jgi:hypothetical protein
MLAVNEGLELNVLGLNIGIDATVPALKLPGNRPAWVRAPTPL